MLPVRTVCLNVWVYSVYLAASAALIPILTGLVLLSAAFLPRGRVVRLARSCIQVYGRACLVIPLGMIRIRFEGRPGLRPDEPFIVVCNHRSMLEPFLVALLPIGPLVQVAKSWPFRIPVLGLAMRLAGYLDINGMARDEFFSRAEEVLRGGMSVVFFPEGTRSNGTKMGKFHGAAFHLFFRTRVPIVPVCISGDEKIVRRGSLLLHPGEIRVRVLPALRRDDLDGLSPYTVKSRVWNAMDRELAAMDAGG